jgi:hypothetical protein
VGNHPALLWLLREETDMANAAVSDERDQQALAVRAGGNWK